MPYIGQVLSNIASIDVTHSHDYDHDAEISALVVSCYVVYSSRVPSSKNDERDVE